MLNEKTIIVTVHISEWTAQKFDKKVTTSVSELYHAGEHSGRFNKQLIAREALQDIRDIVREARDFNEKNTLPWDQIGGRLLTTESYFDYVAAMDRYKMAFEDAVDKFISSGVYQKYREEAVQRLAGMFKDKDYPTMKELRKKYAFTVVMTPVPASGDIRVELDPGEIENIKIKLEDRLARTTKAAMKDLWSRLYEVVQSMAERLSGKKQKIYDTLVHNITDVCALLPKLNFTNDIELAEMNEKILDKLTMFSPDQLRKDDNARTQTAVEARRLLKNLRDYIQ